MPHLIRQILFFLTLLIFSACSIKNAVLYPNGPAKVPIRDQYVILVLVDGGRPQDVNRLIKEGRLPTIKKLFYDSGARFENAITVFPTLSAPAHQAFISGLQPGHHGIPSLDWFSRSNELYMDYLTAKWIPRANALLFNFLQVINGEITSDAPQLIFDVLRGHPTLAAMEAANYGHTDRIGNIPLIRVGYKVYMKKQYEELDFIAMEYILKKLRSLPLEKLPRFSMVDLYGMDFLSHYTGTHSARVTDLYIHIDRFFRDLVKALKARGIYEKTTIVLVSDHGEHDLEGVVDLPKMLRQIGFNINQKKPIDGQIVWGNHGTGTSNLYLKIADDWEIRPTYEQLRHYPLNEETLIDLVEVFRKQPDIETVIIPEGPLKTHMFYTDQHALIERNWVGGKFLYAYLPDRGDDPLNYFINPTIKKWVEEGSFHDAEEWLQETHDLDPPDAVVRVPQLFDDHRIGDLLLVTFKEKQFRKDFVAGHGSLYRGDARVLFMFHGPEIRPGLYPYARITDLFPTLLALYGLESPAPIDGRVRPEIFTELLREEHERRAQIRQNKNHAGMSTVEFQRFLNDKLQNGPITNEEKIKAKELLHSLRQYFKEEPILHASEKPEGQKQKYSKQRTEVDQVD